jgi:hypothetical protein
MQVPMLKGAKIAACVACTATATTTVALVSHPCVVVWVAAAV